MNPLDLNFHKNYIAFYQNKEDYYSNNATPRIFEIKFSNIHVKDEIKPNKNKQYFISLSIEENSEIAIWSDFRDEKGPFRIMTKEYSRRLFPLEHMYFRFFRHQIEFRVTNDKGEKLTEEVDFGITESCLDKATRPQSQNIEDLIIIKKCNQKKYNTLTKLMIPLSKSALNELCNNCSVLFKRTNVYYYLTTIFSMFEKFMEEPENYFPFYYNDSLNVSSFDNLKFSISFEIQYKNSRSIAGKYILPFDVPVKKKIGTNDKNTISLFSSITPLSDWFNVTFKPPFLIRDHILNGSNIIVMKNCNNDEIQLDLLKWFQSIYVQYDKQYDTKPHNAFHILKKVFFHCSNDESKNNEMTSTYLKFMKRTYDLHLHKNVYSRRPQSEI